MRRREFLQGLAALMPATLAGGGLDFASRLLDGHCDDPDSLNAEDLEVLARRWAPAGTNFVYPAAVRELVRGNLNLLTDELRILAVMTGSTAGVEPEAVLPTDFTALDEFDGGGYERPALEGRYAVGRGGLGCAPVTWRGLGPGSREILGFIVHRAAHGTRPWLPVVWVGGGFYPFTPCGADVTIEWSAPEGFVTFAGSGGVG